MEAAEAEAFKRAFVDDAGKLDIAALPLLLFKNGAKMGNVGCVYCGRNHKKYMRHGKEYVNCPHMGEHRTFGETRLTL